MNKLFEYRSSGGLSQSAVAKATGLSQPTICGIERGSETTVNNARRIVDALVSHGVACSLDDVFPIAEKTAAA